jgi:hypothetical protein
MRSLATGRTTLARYQENRLRHFHATLATYIGDD